MPKNKDFLSTSELATLLGVSRVAVFKKIQSGDIKAFKVGRNFIIPKDEFEIIVGKFVSPKRQEEITQAVQKVVREYGDTLRKLGKE